MRANAILLERAEAATNIVAALSVLENAGQNLVTCLIDGAPFATLAHYPADDVIDPESYAQYYFHAHRGGYESGHIHCFARYAPAAALTHVAALSLDDTGRPARFFTTNLWVTDDHWLDAPRLINLLPRMVWQNAPGPEPVNRALTALFILYRRELASLLRRRDKKLAQWAAKYPGQNPLADERLEILSSVAVNLPKTLGRLRRQLGVADNEP
ncbi:MAG: hypothetical protein B7Z75_13760 [Acidocella sp. 20-57-95]|nr:MAG: hypothetical protein B7Z75_13760 [Acidocella sp. 20-57-95]HQT65827.1 hypothetical protein [Acidocella sp.]